MPVINAKVEYLKPAYYDDELKICTELDIDGAKFVFHHKIFNKVDELINTGEITVACIDKKTKKAIKPLKQLLEIE